MNKKNLKQEVSENENESIDVHDNNTNEITIIPEITTEELRIAINKLKKRQICKVLLLKCYLFVSASPRPKQSKFDVAC